MPIERKDVIEVYQRLLGRAPESEATINAWISQCPRVLDLIDSILKSQEWKASKSREWKVTNAKSHLIDYSGITEADVSLLRRYARTSEPEAGFFKNFLGAKTALGYVPTTLNMSGVVEGLPVPASTHSEAIEWVGMIRAVDQAKERFVAVELGAGWGPWIVSSGVAARDKGIKDIHLTGVEADAGKVAFMKEHLSDNGFDPDEHQLLHGVVGPSDGFAYFPEINSQKDYGGEAVFVESEDEVEQSLSGPFWRNTKHVKLDCYSLGRIIGDLPVDLCHFDIQGAEFSVLSSAREIAKAKIKRLVIGTHSRMIEAQLFDLLTSDGWVLENEKPCKFQTCSGKFVATLDGTQVWRNSA